MAKVWYLPIGVALLGGTLGGCSSSPWDPTAEAFRNMNAPNRAPYSALAEAFPNRAIVTPSSQAPATPVPAPGITSSMRNAYQSVTDALTIQPKVTAVSDPTSLASDPGDVGASLHYHAGRVYETQGNIAGSLSHYQQALQIAPNDVRALIAYARLLDQQGSFREAEAAYRRALDVESSSPVVLNDLGMLYARQGMFEDAVGQISQAVQLQPQNQRYRNNLASVLIDAGRAQEALGHLAAVHGEAVAHYNLGYLLAQRRMSEPAIYHLQQAVTLNPYFGPAHQLLDNLTHRQVRTPSGPIYQNASTGDTPAELPVIELPAFEGPTRPLPPL